MTDNYAASIVEMEGTKIDNLILDDSQRVANFISVGDEITKIVPHLARDGSLWFAVYLEDKAYKLINSKYVVEINYER